MAAQTYSAQSKKLDDIKQTLRDVLDQYHENPGKIAEMLAFKNRFWNYSLNNSILIQNQNSGATYVASFRSWLEKGYHVKKGQHGIKVLFPIRTELIPLGVIDGKQRYRRVADATLEEKERIKRGELKPLTYTRFGVGTVFDISQTDCPPQDYPKIFDMGYSSAQHAALYQAFKKFAAQKGIPVEEEDLKSISLRGAFYPDENVIRISDKLNDTERLSTLTHELGHALMHNSRDVMKLPTPVLELEADAVSIMLQQYCGINLTDSRKDHFVQNYNACRNLEGFKLEDALKQVNTAYQCLRKELESIVAAVKKEQTHPALQKNTVVVNAFGGPGAGKAKALLMKKLESYPLPTSLNNREQAALRDAAKRYFLTGEPAGRHHLDEFFSFWVGKGFPVSQKIQGIMTQTYDRIVRDLSAHFSKPADVQKANAVFNDKVPVSSFRKDRDQPTAPEPTTDMQKKMLTRLKEQYPGLKENSGYFILDEVPGRAFGFDPNAPEALVLWSVEQNGEYRGGLYRHTLDEFDPHDLVESGLHTEQIQNMLRDCGYSYPAVEQNREKEKPSPAVLEQQQREEHYRDVLNYIKYGVPILTVAQDMGFTPVKDGNFYSLKEHDSVKFYPDNSYYRFSTGKGGSTVDFVMEFGGYSSKEAIRTLKDQYVGGRYDVIHAVREEGTPIPVPEKKPFVLPQKTTGSFSRAFAYLTKTRCLDPEVVQQCMKDGLIYEDQKHNVVFVGKDEAGNAAFATRHTTLTKSKFKRDVAGSRQDIGWMVKNPKAEKLYICEAPIDAMSIMTFRLQQGKPVEKASYLATCGTGKDKALYTRLRENPNIKVVVFGNDNDEAGKKANRKIFETLKKDFPKIMVKSLIPNNGKDINECLCKRPKKTVNREMEVAR